jgi:hypothetical protein
MLDNMERRALEVKARASPDEPMGIGLWLAAQAAADLLREGRVEKLAEWLIEHGLLAFTINGFPHSDFHQSVVKHDVYEPDWTTEARTRYTLDLIRIQSKLIEVGGEGSISTLPVGWHGAIDGTAGAAEAAASNLLRVVDQLARLEADTGKLVHLDLEPEPGCYLATSTDVVGFFEDHLLPRAREDEVRRHLRVCHDICHAAVMFESQRDALLRYRAKGIGVGKVQVAAAVRAPFDSLAVGEKEAAHHQLRQLEQDRYLHQTVVKPCAEGPETLFFEDLPAALSSHSASVGLTGEWRVHFHVPIFLARFGLLETTQDQILEFLELAGEHTDVRHFESETYTWEVLPDPLRSSDLAGGIAEELIWLRDRAAARRTS